MVDLTEEQAVESAVRGDNQAFSFLYERYVARIYNYIYYRTGIPHEAEDLTERVFMRALGRITSYQNQGVPFSAWLYRIAHNLVANWYRDRQRRQEVSLEDYNAVTPPSDHPEAHIVASQETEGLLKIVRTLPQDRQMVVILKFVEHMSNAEIAVIMNRSESAIKSLYHRTLLDLRNQLEKGN